MTFGKRCGLCGELRAYLARTDWRAAGADPRNVVPHSVELCRARSLGALLCGTCDRRGEEGPPRWPLAIALAP